MTTQQRQAARQKKTGIRKHNDPQPHRDNQQAPRPTTDLSRNRYK